MARRRLWGALSATVGALIMLGGTALTWLHSGARGRSSYSIFDLVERLGFAPGGVVAASLKAWPMVPLMLAVATTAVWLQTNRPSVRLLAAALTATAVGWVGGTAAAVYVAPEVSMFRIGPGPLVTILGAVLMGAGAAVSLVGQNADGVVPVAKIEP